MTMLSRRTRLALSLVQLDELEDLRRQAAESLTLERNKTDIGGIDFPPIDDDDDGGDDEEEWGWENLDAQFKARIEEWVGTSPITGKIANIIYENTFSRKPKINIMRHGGGRKFGRLQMDIAWEYGGDIYDDFGNEFAAILRKSDIYKVFRVRPDQLWNILGKGDVLNWVIYYICTGLSGRMVRRHQSPADKQAAFQIYDFVTKNQAKYKRWIQKKLNPGVPLEITVSRPITSYGQLYNGSFIAGGVVYWEYKPAG